MPSTDAEVVRLLKGLPARIAGRAKTLNTPHQIRYADGSRVTAQPLVEAVGKGFGGAPVITMNRLFVVMLNFKPAQYQVNAQNAPGARLLWFTGKTRPGFFDPTGTEPHPFNIYIAVVAASGGEWIFYVEAGDAGTHTALMRALRLTPT